MKSTLVDRPVRLRRREDVSLTLVIVAPGTPEAERPDTKAEDSAAPKAIGGKTSGAV